MKINLFLTGLLVVFLATTQSTLWGAAYSQDAPALAWGYSSRYVKKFLGEPRMEDRFTVALPDNKKAFFGLYDGHGGAYAAEYVQGNLHKNLTASKKSGRDRLVDAFETTEKNWRCQMREDDPHYEELMGTTATAAEFNFGTPQGNILYLGWVGDSRAVLANNKDGLAFETRDHLPNLADEKIRINTAAGGKNKVEIIEGIPRIAGLGMSRSIGDWEIKKDNPGVIATPEVTKINLTPEHSFLIIASDGVWDKVTSQEAIDIVAKGLAQRGSRTQDTAPDAWLEEGSDESLVNVARALRDTAFNRGSKDNISALVVVINRSQKGPAHKAASAVHEQPDQKGLIDRLVEVANLTSGIKELNDNLQTLKYFAEEEFNQETLKYIHTILQSLSERFGSTTIMYFEQPTTLNILLDPVVEKAQRELNKF